MTLNDNINPKKEYISPIYEEHAVIKRGKFKRQKRNATFIFLIFLFLNLNLFILIGGELFYNIVLVLPYINMNPP